MEVEKEFHYFDVLLQYKLGQFGIPSLLNTIYNIKCYIIISSDAANFRFFRFCRWSLKMDLN